MFISSFHASFTHKHRSGNFLLKLMTSCIQLTNKLIWLDSSKMESAVGLFIVALQHKIAIEILNA